MMFVVLTLAMLAGSMAGGLAVSSQAERQIAAAHRRSVQLGYAAESAAERAVAALEAQPDWLDAPGAFVVGVVTVTPAVVARTTAINRSLAGRFPFDGDTPVWRLVATTTEREYVSAVWVADDPADRDGDAGQDSNGRLMVRSETQMAAGAIRSVEVHLARQGGATRRLSWQEVW
jgi:hypothetical protein